MFGNSGCGADLSSLSSHKPFVCLGLLCSYRGDMGSEGGCCACWKQGTRSIRQHLRATSQVVQRWVCAELNPLWTGTDRGRAKSSPGREGYARTISCFDIFTWNIRSAATFSFLRIGIDHCCPNSIRIGILSYQLIPSTWENVWEILHTTIAAGYNPCHMYCRKADKSK